ncbi:MAG: hypothetical protein R6U28_08735 [Cyclonatronaceae bacterium]
METNRPKSSDIKELKARKINLKQEMEEIQQEIESSLTEVRQSVTDRTRIRYWVDRYPLHLLGSAALVGFLLSRKGSRPAKKKRLSDCSTTIDAPRTSFYSLLMEELKKMITQRMVRYVMNRVEEAIDERKNPEE